MKKFIDLRSDTVTQPTSEMRKAMADAEVGDDVYGEDKTINLLQEKASHLLGKESALFVPSGTMGNLIAILTHCGRGDEAIMGMQGHTFIHEAGGMAALGGVHPYPIPNQMNGSIDIEDIRAAIRTEDVHHPVTRLIILENTQNQCGGLPINEEYTNRIGMLAQHHHLAFHVDGARIFNAAAALEIEAAKLAKYVDTVTFCLSKGLCAPVGSILCGSRDFIKKATHIRKQLGGGMRQAGILAAAGIISLDKMIYRLAEDHQRAAEIARGLSSIPWLTLDMIPPATNMIFASVNQENAAIDAHELYNHLLDQHIKIDVINRNRIRLVTHHDIHDEDLTPVIEAFQQISR